jgi:hypothetical protein
MGHGLHFPIFFLLLCTFHSVFKCVLYCCHRVSTKVQLKKIITTSITHTNYKTRQSAVPAAVPPVMHSNTTAAVLEAQYTVRSISFVHTPCFCTGQCNQLPVDMQHSTVGVLGWLFSTSQCHRVFRALSQMALLIVLPKTLQLAGSYCKGHLVLLGGRTKRCLQRFGCRIGEDSLHFQHCACAALYKVRCDPVQEGCDPGIDARIAWLCAPKSIRYDTDQVETVVLRPHKRSSRNTL